MIALGSLGDVHPHAGIGAELRRRGHHVTLLANDAFQDVVEQAGLNFHAIGTREELSAAAEGFTYSGLAWPKIAAVMETLAITPARRIYDYIEARHQPGETVVTASSFCFGARLAQEKLGVPLVSVDLQPAVFRSRYRAPRVPGLWMPDRMPPAVKARLWRVVDLLANPLVKGKLNRLRAEIDLPAVQRIWPHWLHSPQRVLGLFPGWFAPPQPDWPEQLRLTGFPLYDGPERRAPLPRELETFLAGSDEPPIAFTHGTEYRHGHNFFAVAVDACRRVGRRGILLTRHTPHLPDHLPPEVLHVPYARFRDLLPRVAGLVHHGGIGTTAQA
ncbi:MAG: glycosyltransferase, partial [Planctomycetota bacterium]